MSDDKTKKLETSKDTRAAKPATRPATSERSTSHPSKVTKPATTPRKPTKH